MRVTNLRLRDFRNYAGLEYEPGSGLNILQGENAQGKSNLLEAIYLLATTRSLRAGRESEMIRHGDEAASVFADTARVREGDVELQVHVMPADKKSVRVNGGKRARVLELL